MGQERRMPTPDTRKYEPENERCRKLLAHTQQCGREAGHDAADSRASGACARP